MYLANREDDGPGNKKAFFKAGINAEGLLYRRGSGKGEVCETCSVCCSGH